MERRLAAFQRTVWEYAQHNRRDMPWRPPALHVGSDGSIDAYAVTLSEVMLQQTQVARVIEKYAQFMAMFPSWKQLAASDMADLLRAWQGLGYNRRALYLQRLARQVIDEHDGRLPSDPATLAKLPGIGPGTAGSIAAFVFDQPTVFIETNIRRVFIHHFFTGRDGVGDTEILPLVEQALDREHPREWYYALMDYGSYLAKIVENPNRRSRHYVRQSTFEGSDRQLRAAIVRLLLSRRSITRHEIRAAFPQETAERLEKITKSLIKDGFISPVDTQTLMLA